MEQTTDLAHDFVEEILDAKDPDNTIPQDVREQLAHDLVAQLEQRINAMILNHIPENAQDELSQLLDSDTEGKLIGDFYVRHIPDISERIAAEMMVFRESYLGVAK